MNISKQKMFPAAASIVLSVAGLLAGAPAATAADSACDRPGVVMANGTYAQVCLYRNSTNQVFVRTYVQNRSLQTISVKVREGVGAAMASVNECNLTGMLPGEWRHCQSPYWINYPVSTFGKAEVTSTTLITGPTVFATVYSNNH
ncbi:hypothetical protein ABZV60_32745 [Streptomyces sp. NPDC004787]|uniref:hypothetical protein n=1 Tax=Streptomyces sp. NPDC004787 TaxID=3154291 RepID=UPI0033B38C07